MAFERTIVLLTGSKAAGKGAVSEVFQNESGFAYESLSTRVREIAARSNMPDAPIRVLQDIGNELREKFGGDILAQLTAAKADAAATTAPRFPTRVPPLERTSRSRPRRPMLILEPGRLLGGKTSHAGARCTSTLS